MTVVRIEQTAPDPARPPLQITYGRDDRGHMVGTVAMGGQTVIGAVALMVKTASDVLHDTPMNSLGHTGADIPYLDALAHYLDDLSQRLHEIDERAIKETT